MYIYPRSQRTINLIDTPPKAISRTSPMAFRNHAFHAPLFSAPPRGKVQPQASLLKLHHSQETHESGPSWPSAYRYIKYCTVFAHPTSNGQLSSASRISCHAPLGWPLLEHASPLTFIPLLPRSFHPPHGAFVHIGVEHPWVMSWAQKRLPPPRSARTPRSARSNALSSKTAAPSRAKRVESAA